MGQLTQNGIPMKHHGSGKVKSAERALDNKVKLVAEVASKMQQAPIQAPAFLSSDQNVAQS